MKKIHRSTAIAMMVLLLMPLAACSASNPSAKSNEGTVAEEAPAVQEDAGAVTIDEVFEKVGCKEGDPLGTRGMIDAPGDFDYDPEMVKNGSCRPLEGGEDVYFFEYSNLDDADRAASNGSIEASSGELFQDGAVLIWARSANEQKLIGAFAEEVM